MTPRAFNLLALATLIVLVAPLGSLATRPRPIDLLAATTPQPVYMPIVGNNLLFPASTPTPTPTPTATTTSTPTWCPLATAEPLWVEPIISPTDLLTQTITVRIGNGEAVTITAESGVFAAMGSFNAYANPARVIIDLLANTTHHLGVQAKVRQVQQWGCTYGGYTLDTQHDRYGQPLLIEQQAGARMPAIAPLATSTRTPCPPTIRFRRAGSPQE